MESNDDIGIISTAREFFESDFASDLLWDEDAILADLSEHHESKSQVVPWLTSQLKNPDWEKRQMATKAVAHLGIINVETLRVLCELLGDEVGDVVHTAQDVMVEIGCSVVPVLLEKMNGGEQDVAARVTIFLLYVDYGEHASTIVTEMTRRLQGRNSYADYLELLEAATLCAIRGKAYGVIGDDSSSISDFQRAAKLDAALETGFWQRLAELYDNQGDQSLTNALTYYLSGCEAQNGQEYTKAKNFFIRSAKAQSEFPWGYNNLAWLLSTCDDEAIRDGETAVKAAKKACQLSDWHCHGILDTLAAALAETHQFDQAVKAAKKAVKFAPEGSRPEYEFNVQRYKQGLPWTPYNN